MLNMPLMELQNISDAVESALWFQQVSVLWQKTSIDDPPSIILGFEMGIWEAHKNEI